MNEFRRQELRLLTLAIAAVVLSLGWTNPARSQEKPRPPNIIIFFTDDKY
jgi:hypothetical protein